MTPPEMSFHIFLLLHGAFLFSLFLVRRVGSISVCAFLYKFVQFYLAALNEKINFKRNDFVIAYVSRGLVKILA